MSEAEGRNRGVRDGQRFAGRDGPGRDDFTVHQYFEDHAGSGAEIDLILEMGGDRGTWAIEIKHGLAPTVSKGFHLARHDIAPRRTFIVYSGEDRYPITEDVEVIGLRELATELAMR